MHKYEAISTEYIKYKIFILKTKTIRHMYTDPSKKVRLILYKITLLTS